MREIGRSGSGRCTAVPVPFARAARARRRPGAATSAQAFLARKAGGDGRAARAGGGGSDLLAELRRPIPAARVAAGGGRVRRAAVPRAGRVARSGGAAASWDAGDVAGVHGEADATPRRPVRLTRRGRLVMLGLVLLLGALVGFLAASPGQAADPARPAVTAVVQPGDTLWSFAERNMPNWRPIDAVAELQRLNELEGSVIHPGQRLALPAKR
jgi:hypothetical protein